MKTYPIFLNDLKGRLCVVFGSNHESERKVTELLDCGATVRVIDPELTDTLRTFFEAGQIAWQPRHYQKGDLAGAFLAIASVPNPEVNRLIRAEADAGNVLFNAMDDVPNCTFVAGSVVRQGPLTIVISTSGCAPALSVRMREKFEAEFGPEYGAFLNLLKSLRPAMAERFSDFETRRQKWYELVDGPLLEYVKSSETREIEAVIQGVLE